MPIDITRDDLFTLADAARMFPKPGGGTVKPPAVYRWATIGCRGIVLETAPVGGKLYTTADCIREFSRRLCEARGLNQDATACQGILSDADRAARDELRAAGFKF